MSRPRLSRDELRQQWARVFKHEQELLAARRHNSWVRPNGAAAQGRSYLTGICLSGGGIRSATVALGVLQTLAGVRVLRHIDYMSSVSGGGYTASAVAFQYARGRADADPDADFPFGTEHPRTEHTDRDDRPLLRYLRNHANYLSQNGLVDLSTGAIAVARSLLLNIFLWVTMGGLALAGLMSLFTWLMHWRIAGQVEPDKQAKPACLVLDSQCLGNTFFDAMLFTAAMLAVAVAGLMVAFSLSSWRLSSTQEAEHRWPPQWAFGLGWIVLGTLAFLWTLHAAGNLDQWGAILFFGAPLIWGEHVPALAMLVLLTLYFGGIALGPAWFTEDGLSRKYARRRYQENLSGRAILVILGLLLIGSLPNIRNLLAHVPMLEGLAGADGRGPLSALIYLVALGSALFGFYRANLQGKLGLGSSFLVVAGSAFLIFGALLLGYEVAATLQRVWRLGVPLSFADAFTVAAPVVALALGYFVNINDVGLGRYYRDRLMEAFMPDDAQVRRNEIGPAPVADRFHLADLVRTTGDDGKATIVGPYPLINANVMTHGFGDGVARRRRGDSFILAPAWSGSNATGWQTTAALIEGRLPLATAMATSGAAANPRGGFAGTGPTTNPAVALAMSFLNIRLGYWLRWRGGTGLLAWLNPNGNHFVPGATGFFGLPGAFVELTDGGHFENLGLYELVRRRCGLIIVCEGGDDRLASYASFVAAARRIEEDFGATFAFDVDLPGADRKPRRSGPRELVARAAADEYPKGAEYAARGYFLGSVRYGAPGRARVPMAETGPDEGLVIYLKSAMIPALSLVTRGYKGANADFPYESTADQFFSPEQFEAYRDVGICIARQMLAETGLAALFDDGRPPLDRLRRNDFFVAEQRPDPDPPRPSA